MTTPTPPIPGGKPLAIGRRGLPDLRAVLEATASALEHAAFWLNHHGGTQSKKDAAHSADYARGVLKAYDETLQEVKPGALIRANGGTGAPGIVLRWPRDRKDWEPLNDGSDEWVVLWLPLPPGPANIEDMARSEELICAGDFTVIGHFPGAFRAAVGVGVRAAVGVELEAWAFPPKKKAP